MTNFEHRTGRSWSEKMSRLGAIKNLSVLARKGSFQPLPLYANKMPNAINAVWCREQRSLMKILLSINFKAINKSYFQGRPLYILPK